MTVAEGLATVVAAFAATARTKLSSPAAAGAPEDQLRAPIEALVADLADLIGLPTDSVVLVGESSLADLKTRPDYAVSVNRALIGFIEIKAPGKGADPRRFHDRHDQEQWDKLRSLPNLIYTDGNAFSLWCDGTLAGRVVALDGDITTAGGSVTAPPALLTLFTDFFQWQPIPPRSAAQLAETTARLCRLLREEVTEQLALGSDPLTNLARDWRRLLFPNATDEAFADGYAQAVTFGLLMARARDIPLLGGLDRVARDLRQTNTLIGTALRLLTDDAENEATLKTSLATLTRVLDAVHWPAISKGEPEAWLYFYEAFLTVYDNALRKKTGSYYTPPEVVQAMVRLVDDALRAPAQFGLVQGLAAPDVTVADPAMGTGTFLLGILRRIAETVEADQGPGAVPGAIEAAIARLIGFEIQFGPFAVAQVRLLAEIHELTGHRPAAPVPPLRLFVTDTLGNPKIEQEWIPQLLEPLAESRRQANAIKRHEPITVVIGNPPYKEKAKGLGGWVEAGSGNLPAPLKHWLPPAEWGVGAHAKHLRNLYVYFWRWATWKVFGDGDWDPGTGRPRERKGIVCFITVAGFLNGPGFQKMRAELRAEADVIWVIDCSPEGHQPAVSSRVFEGVQQPVCIVLALRRTDAGSPEPARVRYRALPAGHRQDKFKALAAVRLDDAAWADCPAQPRASFYPSATGAWADYPDLCDLFSLSSPGVLAGRTWVIAPDAQSLRERWKRLVRERDPDRKEVLFHPTLRGGKPADRHTNKVVAEGLFGHESRPVTVANDKAGAVAPTRYGFRSFDRQWILPDNRLLLSARPRLWKIGSNQQIYLTAPHDRTPTSGPALVCTALVPDSHHYHGRGGRVFPLWADREATRPNVKPALMAVLESVYRLPVTARDVLAYIAAVAANPAYTARFRQDLVQPGLRIPLTADPALFRAAVDLGREVVWLHCFGERFADPEAGRPAGSPRLPPGQGPTIPRDGAIPSDPDRMPNAVDYDAARQRLIIGEGFIDNVPKAVWAYQVSGKPVLVQWFSYRRRDRSRPIIGDRRPPSPLDTVQPDHWLAEYTTELLNVLNVLGRLVALEPRQADLLSRICESPLLSAAFLQSAGTFDSPAPRPHGLADARQGEFSL
ncbi:MAG: DNA methyltransferase [Rhodospirillales bacterium]|nr:MAG: DNA methyltransferase [Rhodospirillales bacterium]